MWNRHPSSDLPWSIKIKYFLFHDDKNDVLKHGGTDVDIKWGISKCIIRESPDMHEND